MGNTFNTTIVRLLGSTALLTVAAQPSSAQEMPVILDAEITETVEFNSSAATPLGRIVLGTGVDNVAIDTPQAVTVVDEEQIDRWQPVTISEIFDSVPGTQAIGSERVAGQSFNIRGIGDLAAADESKIIVTIDGAPKFFEQYRVGSFFSDPALLQQVEILRGPASSTLYGAGALGGVINFTTKDASQFLNEGDTSALRLRTSYNSNGEGGLGSLIFATRPTENAEFLASVNYRVQGNYQDGDGETIPGSDFSAWSGLLKGTFHFGESDEKVLRASYTRWQSDADDSEYSQTGTLDTFGQIDRSIVDQTAVISFEDSGPGNPFYNLKAELSFSDTQIDQENATARIPSQLFDDTKYAYRTTAARLENTFEAAGQNWENYLTVGVQYQYQERIADAASGAIGFHPEGTSGTTSLYAQDEFILNDRLTIIPGVRLDWVSLDPDTDVPGATSQDDLAVSPKIAALYQVNDMFGLFGSISRTERVPTLDELFSTSGPAQGYPGGRSASLDLEKETSDTAELGFTLQKTGLATENDAFQLKTTGYYSKLDNLITTNPNTNQRYAVPYYANIDKAKIYGVEVEAYYDAQWAYGQLAYNYVRGEDDQTGETLTSIPADTLALTLAGRNLEHGLTYGARGLFASSISSPDGDFDAYETYGVFMNWAPQEGPLEGYEVALAVENLFDAQYQNNLSGDYGAGRTFRATLTKQTNW